MLAACDAVVYDYLADEALLEFAPEHAARVYVGKTGAHRGAAERQSRIHAILIQRAREGQVVVRLKGGDPFVFGRGGEEAEELRRAGVRFEVVPGISSMIAAPAYAGIPLTHRDINTAFACVTGHEDPNRPSHRTDWSALAGLASRGGTLLIVMGVKHLRRNLRFLCDHGVAPELPAALVRWGTKPNQQTVAATVGTLADEVERAGLGPPAVVVVGEVVRLREELAWFEQRPLVGKRVLITREARKTRALADEIRALGGMPVEVPSIAIVPPETWAEVDAGLGALGETDWVVWTSANAVRVVLDRAWELGLDARIWAGAKLACVGASTAQALEAYGLRADVVPDRHISEGLFEAIQARGPLNGARVWMPHAERGRMTLKNALEEAGACVDRVVAYRTVTPDPEQAPIAPRERLEADPIHVALFASPSAVHGLAELVGEAALQTCLRDAIVACIGPVTARAARDQGLDVAVVPQTYTIAHMMRSVIDRVQAERSA